MRRTPLVAPAALLLLALAGCSASSGSADLPTTDSGGSYAESGGELVAPSGEDSSRAEAGGLVTGEGTTASDTDGRQIVTSGYMTITAEQPVEAAGTAVEIVERAGGRVDARQEYAPRDGDLGSATLTVRIPSARLTATLDELRALGETDEVSLESTDVTVESQDLDARITALAASIDRLTGLVATAGTTKDLIELETAISSRQGELESLEAQRRGLRDQVSLSTVQLTLRSEAAVPRTHQVPGDFLSGLGAGWGAFVAFWSGLLVVTGVVLPWVVFLGIAAVVVILIVRRRRGRVAAESPASDGASTSSP
ncbi:MAG: DUF4349 domain-containing protein [Microbacteriaceae bacterium]